MLHCVDVYLITIILKNSFYLGIVIWRYTFEFVVDTKTRGCVVKVTVIFSSKFSYGTTHFFSSQKWSAHWKTMNGCIYGIYRDYKFSRHLFKSFPEPIIWARCSIISACVLCCLQCCSSQASYIIVFCATYTVRRPFIVF